MANYHLHQLYNADTFCFIHYPALSVHRTKKSLTLQLCGSPEHLCPITCLGTHDANLKLLTAEGEFAFDKKSTPILVSGGARITLQWDK
ncbi:MAG TPA: hypothetical protein PKA53_04045 [Sphingobacterium sp.]|nr:hypothetical protein [Sphingobacterium sp.]